MNLTPSKEINDIYNQTSDTNMGGTSIGNSAPTIDLDKKHDTTGLEGFDAIQHQIDQVKNDPFTPYNENTGLGGLQSLQDQIKQHEKELEELLNEANKEPEKTQGQLEQELSDLNKELENTETIYDNLNNVGTSSAKDKAYILNLLSEEELAQFGIKSTYGFETPGKITALTANGIKQEKIDQIYDYLKDKYNNQLSSIKDQIYNIKNNSNYDNRTDSQIREDMKDSSAYQTVVEDMRKAGLNPAMLSGAGYAGGGGGGSSRAEEEEEKKKRKKRELLEQLKMEQQEKARQMQQLLYVVGMLGGTGGMLGSALIRNAGYTKFWEAQMAKNASQKTSFNNPGMKNNTTGTKQHTTRNEPNWLEKYLKDIEAMG